MPLSDSEIDMLQLLAGISSAISFLGCLYIILSYLTYPVMRRISLQIVLFLTLSDLGACIAFFLGNTEKNDIACEVQAIFLTYFQLASVLWTTV